MSEENLEIVRSALDAWNRQDVEGLVALADPDVEWVNAPDAVEPGTRKGRDELAYVVRTQWEALPGAHQEIRRLHVRGEEVISETRVSRAMPGSDARVGNHVLMAWKIRDGKVARIEVLAGGSEFRRKRESLGLD
jgi:ketosteroid isomerase-like protein